MTKPTITNLAEQGIAILRAEFVIGCYDGEAEEALTALCDYAEAAIASRRKGGRVAGLQTGKKTGKNGGRKLKAEAKPESVRRRERRRKAKNKENL